MTDEDQAPAEYVPLTSEDRAELARRLEADLAGIRSDFAQVDLANAERVRIQTRLRTVSAALRRIRSGSYGECALCGGEIGRVRLFAVPSTPYCRHCEEDG